MHFLPQGVAKAAWLTGGTLLRGVATSPVSRSRGGHTIPSRQWSTDRLRFPNRSAGHTSASNRRAGCAPCSTADGVGYPVPNLLCRSSPAGAPRRCRPFSPSSVSSKIIVSLSACPLSLVHRLEPAASGRGLSAEPAASAGHRVAQEDGREGLKTTLLRGGTPSPRLRREQSVARRGRGLERALPYSFRRGKKKGLAARRGCRVVVCTVMSCRSVSRCI